MKKIAGIVLLWAASFGAMAQGESGIEICLLDETDDISGTTYEFTGGDLIMEKKFVVKNVGLPAQNFRIERIKVDLLAGTGDSFCWGIFCYPTEAVSVQDPFVSDDGIEIETDASSILFTYHETMGNSGCARYRYFVIDDMSNRIDSLDVMFCSTVSVDEEVKNKISVYPSPAVDVLTVNLETALVNGKFKLFNTIGEEVLAAPLKGLSNSINVGELPNGVYFYAVLNESNIVEIKKLVIKH